MSSSKSPLALKRSPSAASASTESMDSLLLSPREVKELNPQYLQTPITRLDEGGTSIIYLCKYNGIDIAVKQLKTDDQDFLTAFDNEIKVHSSVQHVNIVKVYGFICGTISEDGTSKDLIFRASTSRKLLVCEYCGGGNLRVYLDKLARGERAFFELDIINYLRDISKGLDYLHGLNNVEKGIIHGDLKPENIFLERDLRRAKIGDLGLACELKRRSASSGASESDGDGQLSSNISYTPTLETFFDTSCTMYYTAPECWGQQRYVRQSDVYSFGMVLYNVFFTMNRQVMYRHADIMGKSENYLEYDALFKQKIINGYRPSLHIKPTLPFSSSTMTEMKNLIENCWDPEFAKRPRFDQITLIFRRLRDRLRLLLSNASKLSVLDISSFRDKTVTHLGHGGMGIAYAGTLQVALKKIIKPEHANLFQREIDLQAMIVHENIVKVLGIAHVRLSYAPSPQGKICQLEEDPDSIVMVSELCANGNLLQYLQLMRERRIPMDESRLVSFMLDIARGMEYLHSMRIIHKDLKTENIFLHNDCKQAKIGDFGIARVMKGNRRTLSIGQLEDGVNNQQQDISGMTYTEFDYKGSPFYIAPECMHNKHASRAMDVYSFGIILHNVFITQDNQKTYNQPEIIGNGVVSNFVHEFFRQFQAGLRPIVPENQAHTNLSQVVFDVIIPMIRDCLCDIDVPLSPTESSSSAAAAAAVEEAITPVNNDSANATTTRPSFKEICVKLEKLKETLLGTAALPPLKLPGASSPPSLQAVGQEPVAVAAPLGMHDESQVNHISLSGEVSNIDNGPLAPSDLMQYGNGYHSNERTPIRPGFSSSTSSSQRGGGHGHHQSSFNPPSPFFQMPDAPASIDGPQESGSVRAAVETSLLLPRPDESEFRSFQMVSALTAMKKFLPPTNDYDINTLPLVECVQRLVVYLAWEDEQHDSGKLRDKVYRMWVSCGRPEYVPRSRQKTNLLLLKSAIFEAMGIQEQGPSLAASLQEVAEMLGIGAECLIFTKPNEKASVIADELSL